ncbi:MAG TPA: ABC transporter substrate-binding protein [Puia sp.]|jgi:iron complex transport system substrate-binding protein|nr:ABC transporter substrate-binding protein [Puia sp.]
MNRRKERISILLVGLVIWGCHSQPGRGAAAAKPASEKPATPRSTLKYAHGFRIDYYEQYREISIANRMAGQTDTLHYLLVDSGVPPPADRPGIPVIVTPVKQMAVQSSVHVALAGFAGVADRIVGLGSFQYINSPVVREGIRTGRVRQIGIDSKINTELLISMHPGVLIAMTNPNAAFGQYQPLMDAGIPVMPDAEWMETTPLGRAEWVKLIGALVDKEDSVNKKFDSVEQVYLKLADIGRAAKEKPTVIVNMPFKGVWYLPAGDNFMTQFLRDAGASYPWADTRGSNSLSLNFEAVSPVALKADFWLNQGYVDSKSDLLASDSRFSGFHSFQTGALWNYNKRVNDIGSNDFWESGIVNPHLILADMIRILHPGLLPADTLYYYKQLK